MLDIVKATLDLKLLKTNLKLLSKIYEFPAAGGSILWRSSVWRRSPRPPRGPGRRGCCSRSDWCTAWWALQALTPLNWEVPPAFTKIEGIDHTRLFPPYHQSFLIWKAFSRISNKADLLKNSDCSKICCWESYLEKRNKSTGLWRLYALWLNLLGVSAEAAMLTGGWRFSKNVTRNQIMIIFSLYYQGEVRAWVSSHSWSAEPRWDGDRPGSAHRPSRTPGTRPRSSSSQNMETLGTGMRQARGEIILINIYYQILLSRYNEKIDGTTIYMAYISSRVYLTSILWSSTSARTWIIIALIWMGLFQLI